MMTDIARGHLFYEKGSNDLESIAYSAIYRLLKERRIGHLVYLNWVAQYCVANKLEGSAKLYYKIVLALDKDNVVGRINLASLLSKDWINGSEDFIQQIAQLLLPVVEGDRFNKDLLCANVLPILCGDMLESYLSILEENVRKYPSDSDLNQLYGNAILYDVQQQKRASDATDAGYAKGMFYLCHRFRVFLEKNINNWNISLWDGKGSHEKINVIGHSGAGDVIQNLRFMELLKQHFKVVNAWVAKDLAPLLASTGYFENIYDIDDLPKISGVCCDFLMLPIFFKFEQINTRSSCAKFNLALADIEHWKAKVAHLKRPHIGVAWAGVVAMAKTDHGYIKAVPVDMFEAMLAPIPNQFISLQVGSQGLQHLDQEEFPYLCNTVFDLGSEIKNYYDTACLIESLDLVICVDTSVAHLAATMGKPVWLILSNPCKWLWMSKNDRMVVYPSVRLFQQYQSISWNEVINDVSTSLIEYFNDYKT